MEQILAMQGSIPSGLVYHTPDLQPAQLLALPEPDEWQIKRSNVLRTHSINSDDCLSDHATQFLVSRVLYQHSKNMQP